MARAWFGSKVTAGAAAVGRLRAPGGVARFTGPGPRSGVEADLLARGWWALTTEAFRSGQALAAGPLARFRARPVTAEDLLALAPPAGLDQLARFSDVFEATLIPRVTARAGKWALGPVFAGSHLIEGADGDLVAAGLLVDLKTSAKLTLTVNDMWQLVGYALLDFDDSHQLDAVGIFTARYAYLVTWGLGELLDELAGNR